MNNKHLRKIISCVLAVIMIFGISTTAFAASETQYKNPIIVINGIDHNPLLANPNTAGAEVVFPPSDEVIAFELGEMFTLGIAAVASNNYEEIMNYFVGSQIYGKLEAIQLNPDGTSKSDNIGPNTYEKSLSYYVTDQELLETIAGSIGIGVADRVGYGNVYVFTYDWRIDPVENAKKLNDFIQTVKSNSRRDVGILRLQHSFDALLQCIADDGGNSERTRTNQRSNSLYQRSTYGSRRHGRHC